MAHLDMRGANGSANKWWLGGGGDIMVVAGMVVLKVVAVVVLAVLHLSQVIQAAML